MSAEALNHAAAVVARLKMYPYFDVANYILMCMMVREDSGHTLHRDQAAGEIGLPMYLFGVNTHW